MVSKNTSAAQLPSLAFSVCISLYLDWSSIYLTEITLNKKKGNVLLYTSYIFLVIQNSTILEPSFISMEPSSLPSSQDLQPQLFSSMVIKEQNIGSWPPPLSMHYCNRKLTAIKTREKLLTCTIFSVGFNLFFYKNN